MPAFDAAFYFDLPLLLLQKLSSREAAGPSYNHAEEGPGDLFAAAKAGDVTGVQAALDKGSSTEESDGVSAAWSHQCRVSCMTLLPC